MNKEEAIKEAYGENWIFYKDHVNENGWINDREFWGKWPKSLTEIIWQTTDHDDDYYDTRRPKSLQGIENNNGWIKIGDGKELPCESINCFIDLGDDDVRNGSYFKPINDSTGTFFDNNGEPFLMDEVEAFYPIERPKQRIY